MPPPPEDSKSTRSSEQFNSNSQPLLPRLRAGAGTALVEGVAWVDAHRRQLLLGSLLSTAGGLALLLAVHGLPGHRRFTSQQQLVARLLTAANDSSSLTGQIKQHSLSLPVLLAGAEVGQHDGRLRVRVVHRPVLLRVQDWWRGAAPQQLPAAHEEALTCSIAGLQGVDPGVPWLLQQQLGIVRPQHASGATGVRPAPVCSLRLLTVTRAGPAGADGAPTDGAQPTAVHGQEEVWGELRVPGLPRRILAAAAAAAAASTSRRAGQESSSSSSSQQRPRSWGRRRDLAELLLRHGLARCAPPEDAEWLGMPLRRAAAHARAEQRARRRRLGVHQAQQQRPAAQGLVAALRRLLGI